MGADRRGRQVSGAALLCAVVLAGCGGGEDGPRAAADKATARSTPAAKAAAEGGATKPVRVDMKDFAFSPARAEVAAGGKVTWTDRDEANHTATFESDAVRSVENLRPGKRASVTFGEPGSYAYVCEFHPTMTGTVVVQ